MRKQDTTTKFTAKEIDALWIEFCRSYCGYISNSDNRRCGARSEHRRIECIRPKCFVDFLQKRGRIMKMPDTHNPDQYGNCGNCSGGFCVGCQRKPKVKVKECRLCGKIPTIKRDSHLFTISCCGQFATDTDGALAIHKWNGHYGR